jgi:fluoroquinolone transport system ATP-binding protein
MIKVQGLSYRYPGSDQTVLEGLEFEIGRGEIFGFLGPSGAGKSTTQKVLYKNLHGFTGEVIVDNKPLSEWGSEYYEKIGVGFELPNHYLKLTARENLQLFASFYPSEKRLSIEALLEQFGLAADSNKKVADFSKGMKMRLNFIRAIMHDPDILFLDEPTSGLDPINSQKIKHYIKKLRDDGKAIFVTTHDMTTADEICDRVSFIADGKIRLTAEPAKLKREHGKRSVLVELENGKRAEFELAGLALNKGFLDLISQGEILRINSQEATLEEVFIKVTGTRLSD